MVELSGSTYPCLWAKSFHDTGPRNRVVRGYEWDWTSEPRRQRRNSFSLSAPPLHYVRSDVMNSNAFVFPQMRLPLV